MSRCIICGHDSQGVTFKDNHVCEDCLKFIASIKSAEDVC